MTQQDLVSYLSERGWNKQDAEKLYLRPFIDKSLTVCEWKKTFVGAFFSKYTALGTIMHLSGSLEKDIPQWEDLTLPNLSDFKDYLQTKVARNTAVYYVRLLSAVMNIYIDNIPAKNFKTALKTKREPSQHVALTEEEVERIHNYRPRSVAEHDIKRAFMLECLCGARSCDIANITEDNIKDGWLTYISQKTKTETSVPVHRHLMQYLNDKPHKKEHSSALVGLVLKRICRKCGINEEIKLFNKGMWRTEPKWKFVNSHTARRSFATQLALRGVPVATISKLMGHSSTMMTSRYICINKQDIGDVAMGFFS